VQQVTQFRYLGNIVLNDGYGEARLYAQKTTSDRQIEFVFKEEDCKMHSVERHSLWCRNVDSDQV